MRLALEGPSPPERVYARRVPRPRFNRRRGGRTWDSVAVHIDGVRVELHADTTWGRRGYFTLDGGATWHAVPILRHDPFGAGGLLRYVTVAPAPADERASRADATMGPR